MNVGADKGAPFEIARLLVPARSAVSRTWPAAFLATLHRAAPHVTEGSITGRQGIEMITLRERQSAIITEPLNMGFHAHLGVIRRPLRSAVEIDVELNLQSSNIFFQ